MIIMKCSSFKYKVLYIRRQVPLVRAEGQYIMCTSKMVELNNFSYKYFIPSHLDWNLCEPFRSPKQCLEQSGYSISTYQFTIINMTLEILLLNNFYYN